MTASKIFSRAGLTSAVMISISLLTGILAARVLGPEQRGYLALIVFWPQLLAVFLRVPFSNVMVVLIGRGYALETLGRRALTISFFAIALALPAIIAFDILILSDQSLEVVVLSVLFAIALVFCSQQTQVFEGILRATKRFDLLNAMRLSVPLGYLVFGAAFALLGFGLAGFVAAHATAMMVSFGFRFFLFRDTQRSPEPMESPAEVDTSTILHTAASFYAIAISTYLSANVDRFFVMLFSTASEIGQYFVAISVAQPLNTMVVAMLQTVGLPQMIGLSAEREIHTFGKLMRTTVLVSGLSAIALGLMSPLVIPLVFGADFAPAGTLSALLSIVLFLTPVRNAASQLLLAVDRARSVSFSNAAYLVAFAVAYIASYLSGIGQSVVIAFLAANIFSAGWILIEIRAYRPELANSKTLIPNSRDLHALVQIIFSAFARPR